MIFAKVKQIRLPNAISVWLNRDFLENNLAECIKNIKSVDDFT
jgi:hypothetical protein